MKRLSPLSRRLAVPQPRGGDSPIRLEALLYVERAGMLNDITRMWSQRIHSGSQKIAGSR
jgi:hypothetical protein